MKKYAAVLLVRQNGGVRLTPITVHLADDNGEAITEATNEFFSSLNDHDSCVIVSTQSLLIEE